MKAESSGLFDVPRVPRAIGDLSPRLEVSGKDAKDYIVSGLKAPHRTSSTSWDGGGAGGSGDERTSSRHHTVNLQSALSDRRLRMAFEEGEQASTISSCKSSASELPSRPLHATQGEVVANSPSSLSDSSPSLSASCCSGTTHDLEEKS